LNTDHERRKESKTPSPEEKETYPQQEIRDSLEMWESYCPKNDTRISQKLKKSNSRYWKQRNSKTRTREKYGKQAMFRMRFKISRETCMKEENK